MTKEYYIIRSFIIWTLLMWLWWLSQEGWEGLGLLHESEKLKIDQSKKNENSGMEETVQETLA